ncbi:MAG: hypothetical protein ABL973_18005 [Micropepsaceae bacterium]
MIHRPGMNADDLGDFFTGEWAAFGSVAKQLAELLKGHIAGTHGVSLPNHLP